MLTVVTALVAPASALTETTPNTNGKNADCPASDSPGLKLDDINDALIPNGTYGDIDENGVVIEITNSGGSQGNLHFDWAVVDVADGFEVTQVVVKGSTIRQYFPGGESGSVTFTVNHWYSHVSFCLGTGETEDVCENLDGIQTEVPDGYHFDEQSGDCLPDDNGEVPDAPSVTHNTRCEVEDTYTIPETDEDNPFTYEIDGDPVAAGTYDLGEGESATIVAVPEADFSVDPDADTEWTFEGSNVQNCSSGGGGGSSSNSEDPTDLCPNLTGDQATVPDGLVILNGNCTTLPVDVCTNIEGEQATVPDGMELNDGVCSQGEVLAEIVEAPTTTTPAPVLPFTGSNTTPLAVAGMLLVALGGTLEVVGRRNRNAIRAEG